MVFANTPARQYTAACAAAARPRVPLPAALCWLIGCLLLCLGLPPAQAALVAEYRFEDTSYNGTAGEVLDASGNARHGRTLGATSTASGRTCRGLSVGTNTSSSALAMDTGIAMPSTVGGTGSISFWYFSDSTDGSDRVLLDATTASNARFLVYRGDDSASPSTIDVDLGFVVTSASGAEHAIFKNDAMSDGAWWHITVTWKLVLGGGASRIRTYVNGSLMSEASFSIAVPGLASGIGTLYLGDNRSSATSVQNSAIGRFDTVRLYNHELTTTEINADRTASPACSLLHHLELTAPSASGPAGSPQTFTVKACANASCSSLYTDGVTGNLTASGAGMSVSYPAGAAFSIGAGGSTTVQATFSPSGSVTLGLSGVSPSAVTSPAVYCGMGVAASAGGSCTYTTTTALNHLRIEHGSGSGVTCTPSTLTVRACQNADCSTPYTGGVSGSLTATGSPSTQWPSGQTFAIAAGASSTTVAVQVTQPGSVLLGSSGLSPAPANATSCNFGSPSCTFTATASGFLISVPHHVAETTRALTVTAVRTDTNTGACTPAFANVSQAVNFSCQHLNPASGTRPVRINGGSGAQVLNATASTSAGCDGSTRAVTLNFNASGVATPTLQYADVGEVRLNASFSGSGSAAGLSMAGSTSFVAQPWYLVLSVPATTKVAGSPFTATVTGITSASVAAPNFGKETPTQAMTFGWVRTRPSGTGAVNGSFSGGSVGSFTNGSASVSNLVWSEVGRGDLSVWFSSANYLGSGWQTAGSSNLVTTVCANEGGTCTVPAGASAAVAYGTSTAWKALTNFSGSTSCTAAAFGGDPAPGQTKSCFYLLTGGANTSANGNVGPFRPHHLALNLVPGCGAFSYAGQGASATVLARNAQSVVTENYDGSANTSPNFARAVTLSEPTALGLGTMSGTAIAATGFFRGSATASPNYTFTSKTSGPGIWSLRATDSDGVSSAPAGGGVEGSVPLRSGRLRISNAFGRANAALEVPLVAEYWNNQAWLHSSGDNCTGIALGASNVALSNPRGATGAASAASTSASMGAWSNGRGTLVLAAPSPAGSSLSLDLAINLGSTGTDQSCNASKPATVAANKAWLRSHNGFCGGSSASNRDPAARASFGIYTPESRRVVLVREF